MIQKYYCTITTTFPFLLYFLGAYPNTVAKLIIQKYLRLEKFFIRSYLIDNEE